MYGAVMCSDENKKKIIRIYNNDGPGISEEILVRENYEKIREKVVRIIPDFSIIGMLFEPDVPAQIVESSARGGFALLAGLICMAVPHGFFVYPP